MVAPGVLLDQWRGRLRASEVMQEHPSKHEKIAFMWDTVVEDSLGEPGSEGGVRAVEVRHVKTNEIRAVKCCGRICSGCSTDKVCRRAIAAAG